LHRQPIATLRHDRIDPPCVLDGPINSENSKGYIEHFLVPTLMPGVIVIRTQFFEVGVIPLRPHGSVLVGPDILSKFKLVMDTLRREFYLEGDSLV
jgi:hypothetical protein